MRGYFGVGVDGISKPMNLGNLVRIAHAFDASFFFSIAPRLKLSDAQSDTSRAQGALPFYSFAQPADLRFNGSVVWGRDGYSFGSVVNYVDGFTDNRPGKAPRKIGSFTTASLFLGLALERLLTAPGAKDSELQLVVANLFDQRPNFLPDAVLGFDPYNNPPNPRTVSLVFTKRFGR